MVTTDHGRRRGPLHIGADRPFVVVPAETWYAHKQPQRLPQQQSAHERAPTRGAPTARTIWTSAGLCIREGAHMGGGHPQGVPTARTICQRALVFAHERAPTRGEGTHKGCPYGPNDMATSVGFCICTRGPTRGEGTHEGCPYGPNDMSTSVGLCAREGAHKGGGHPQGVPLRPERYATSAGLCAREGTHKGGGHPQGVPLRARTIGQRAIGNERW